MKVHCFFEQSGTFKNEFKKLGYEAYDYDILDDFGETDCKIDLFAEISKAYEGGASVFDNISKEDLIMAFFPCIRFEEQIWMSFQGNSYQQKDWSNEKKIKYCMKLHEELASLYALVNKLFLVCMDKGLQLIVENPYSQGHYLRRYWCMKPSLIDKNRRERGDYYVKPTQYWFVNCEPKNNLIFEATKINAIGGKDAINKITGAIFNNENVKNRKVARSMIHPDYANRFIREFILEQ